MPITSRFLPSGHAIVAPNGSTRNSLIGRCRRARRVEAAGIEPASADAPVRASTSLGRPLDSPGGRCATDLPRTSPPSMSRLRRVALLRRRARLLMPAPGRGLARADTLRLSLETRQRVRDRDPHLHWFRLFYEADRRPRLAARPENRPRRSHGAPVCLWWNCTSCSMQLLISPRSDRAAGPRARGSGSCRRARRRECGCAARSRGA